MKIKVSILQIDDNGAETPIYHQVFNELDHRKLIAELQRSPRKRKARTEVAK